MHKPFPQAWFSRFLALGLAVLSAAFLAACGGGEEPAAQTAANPNFASLPARTWTYLPDPDAYCGNGSTTGFAVNPVPESDTVMLYLQGGGACWDGLSCYGIDGRGGTATNFTQNFQKDEVLADVASDRTLPIFDRARAENPFRNMTQVYVPYCTGDLHAGTRVSTHTFFFQQRPAYHTGARNLDAFLKQLVPMSPQVKRVVLVGASAGGYGATFNWWRVRAAFGPSVRVDVLDDSGPTVDPSGGDLWDTWRNAWSLSTPPGCPDCVGSPTAWLPHYAATIPAPARYALVGYLQDSTVRSYGLLSGNELSRRLQSLRAGMATNQKSYFLNGTDHVTIDLTPWPANSSGQSMAAWVQQFLNDDPAWTHSGP